MNEQPAQYVPRHRKNASKYIGYDKATFRVRPDLLEKLRKLSFYARKDMSEILNAALEQHLTREEEKSDGRDVQNQAQGSQEHSQ